MKIYNSMTQKKEDFIPIDGNNVKMYACGITVYDLSHIGHARQAIVYSMIDKYLKYRGYNVTYIRNYTDIDDKIINRSNELHKNALEFSKEQIAETEYDMNNLHVQPADKMIKASDCIPQIINFTENLVKKGYAYVTKNGDVYFRVKNFKEYGKLSHRNIDDLYNGVRIELDTEKEDARDFALWKSAKENEISFESPFGLGRPGWHIECSTMILETLGETIDIHGGGRDLLFPHHENEIAQSEALTGKMLAKYWVHSGLIKINGEKMSKSLHNSLTIRDALKKYNFEVILFLMLSKHYRADIDIKDADYLQSEARCYYYYKSLYDAENIINEYKNNGFEITFDANASKNLEDNFIKAMDDDFNTPMAISHLNLEFKELNKLCKSASNTKDKEKNLETVKKINNMYNSIKNIYGIFGFFTQDSKTFLDEIKEEHLNKIGITKDEILQKIEDRKQAKANKDYQKADEIRDELLSLGIALNDSITNQTTFDIVFDSKE